MQRLRSLFVSFSAALTLSFVWMSPAFAADSPEVAKITSFIQSIMNVLIVIAGALAGLFLIIGGIQYVISSNNPQKLDGAKQTITNSAIGLIICLGALVITNLVTSLATSAFGK
jgi:TRAP-type C4-dicarboxylate transport system permease small subunit